MSKARTRGSRKAPRATRRGAPAKDGRRRQDGGSMASALAQMEAGRHGAALQILERLHTQRPHSAITLEKIAECYTALRRTGEALPWWQRLCEVATDDPKAWFGLAVCRRRLGHQDHARKAFDRVVEIEPQHADALIALCHDSEKRDRLDEMEGWLAKLIAAHPAHPIRHFLRALLLERRGEHGEALAQLLDAPVPGSHEVFYPRWAHLRGRLLDRAGRCAEAFEAHEQANHYHLSTDPQLSVVARDYIAEAQHLLAALPEQDYSHWERSAPAGPQVIWQVGFPRSGTTLLDQVLDSHPQVTVVSEANTLAALITILDQLPGGYPGSLDALGHELVSQLRGVYLATLARHGGPLQAGKVYIDKNPLWTLHLPLLARLFPRAPVLSCRRHPADACLSAYSQHFALNRAMSCFLHFDSTVALYNAVMDCDERFARLFPFQRRYEVRYEELVQDLEAQVRSILSFLSLPWDPSVLDYHQHAASRAIQTASYHQAVQPVYASAVDRWRRYRRPLASWLPLLARHARRLGYSLNDADSKVA